MLCVALWKDTFTLEPFVMPQTISVNSLVNAVGSVVRTDQAEKDTSSSDSV